MSVHLPNSNSTNTKDKTGLKLPTTVQNQVALIVQQAYKTSQMTIYLGYLAIICFLVFGTLASLKIFHHSSWIYVSFHYLPYVLVGISVPISLYHMFILYRYRLVQPMILGILLSIGSALPLFGLVTLLWGHTIVAYMALFLGVIAWFCMPYLFKVSFQRYLQFVGIPAPTKR